MRMLFVVGEAGILGTSVIFLISLAVAFLTFLSVTAIATNIEVGGGGAYYIISRTLGPESGITIGLVYFIYVFLAIPFCIMGFCEAMTITILQLKPYLLWIELGISLLLFIIAFAGSALVVKSQYLQIGAIALSIIFFIGGAIPNFSTETLQKNLYPPLIHTYIGRVENTNSVKKNPQPPRQSGATALNKENISSSLNSANIANTEEEWKNNPDKKNLIPSENLIESTLSKKFPGQEKEIKELEAIDRFQLWLETDSRYDFWILFAIFMPVVTGIMTGANMSSGDLKNPSRSIVHGSFWGIITVFIIFCAQSILFAGVAERKELIIHPYDTLCNNALFGWSWVITLGMAAATISSAI